ncbi:MAG: glycosyltransferase family 2 protein [Candidatus Daviesbacteria bacterium]|nr:glycosyltransferase family 2 protein [Candidatus Daviesbacteria bacterium]
MPKVVVVILNYKVKELTLRAVESVKKSSYENLQIIVIDNDSGDGLVEEIAKIKEVIFIQNSENLGYSGGNNIGIKRALDDKADYVLILNPDAEVKADAISKLVEAAKLGADILGPKIYFSDKKTIWYAGGIFDFNNVIGKHRGVDELDQGQYNTAAETDFVTGAAIMISKKVLEKIGLFDERYFLYYEDSDYCVRAKKAHFKVMYIPDSIAYHLNAQSTKLGSPIQDYYITRNRLLFAAKFLSLRTRFALLREAARNISSGVRRKALFDFLLGKFGKADI